MPVITPAQQLVEETPNKGDIPPNVDHWISKPGDLTQFGAFIEVLQPGTRSSITHWHSNEDEMVYVLEGVVTLIEGKSTTLLHPGDAATFKAGVPVGHCLWNQSRTPTRCLIVGTRAQIDKVTYPEHDRVLHRDRTRAEDRWTDAEGNPTSNPYADW